MAFQWEVQWTWSDAALEALGDPELEVGDDLDIVGTVRVTELREDQREGRARVKHRRATVVLTGLGLTAPHAGAGGNRQ